MVQQITSSPSSGAPTLPEAQAAFVAAFADDDVAADLGGRLNCAEVDALAGLLRAFGRDEAAELWIKQHATDDDEGDAHTPEGERDSWR